MLLVVGSIGLDTIKTPFGEKPDILGGSVIHASVSASFYHPVSLVGVAGTDFPKEHIEFLHSRQIDTAGLQILPGKTFRWSGYYEYDMNQAHTRATDLNVYAQFDPQVPAAYRGAEYVFLANFDPALQLKVLEQMQRPKLVAMDTMNFWISSKRQELHAIIKKVDVVLMNDSEARQFMETPNLPLAAQHLLKMGPRLVIIKKGEHGALLFGRDFHFSAPSYPQQLLRDPTGAGDSFAGGFMGYLAKTGDLSESNLRRAVIVGSVMASFNVEDFSLDRLKSLTRREIVERFEELRRFAAFESLTLANWH